MGSPAPSLLSEYSLVSDNMEFYNPIPGYCYVGEQIKPELPEVTTYESTAERKVPSLSDISEAESSVHHSQESGRPLSPGVKENFGDVLRTTYGTWDADRERLGIPRDPRLWSEEHVSSWLAWAIREFSLQGPHIDSFVAGLSMSGRQVCAITKDQFLARAPPFMGDILWAHLEILQKEVDKENAKVENVPVNFSEPFSVPDQFQRTYTTLGTATPTSLSTVPPPPSSLAGSSLPPSLPPYSRSVERASRRISLV